MITLHQATYAESKEIRAAFASICDDEAEHAAFSWDLQAWFDSKLGTTPFLLLLGAFVGAAAGFYSLYFHIVIEPRIRDEEEQ